VRPPARNPDILGPVTAARQFGGVACLLLASCGDDAAVTSSSSAVGGAVAVTGAGGDAAGGGSSSSEGGASGTATSSAGATTGGAGAAGHGGGGDGGGDGDGGQGGGNGSPRLDEIIVKASHNSYERAEAHFDILGYHRVRAIELDIHPTKSGWDPMPGNWFVYHDDGIGQGQTTCHRLTDCLDELLAFGAAVPAHELVTVFVDLKDETWSGTAHAPADLDALLLDALGSERIFTPGDLQAHCDGAASPREAVQRCAWPRTASLRGRFAFALTGGTMCGATGKLRRYEQEGSVAFVAPAVEGSCATVAAYDAERAVVFINLAVGVSSLASDVAAAGLLSRVYGLNDEASWDAAWEAGTHFLATDKVNYEVDAWARTHGERGFPFACRTSGLCEDRVEPSPPVGIEVESGDLWEGADDGVLAVRDDPATDVAYEAAIGTRNSHIEPFAKGCLVARASNAPGAANFAVCRPADENVVRVQLRPSSGADTEAFEVDVVPDDTVDQESVPWVRLAISGPASAPTVRGEASLDGESWELIEEHTFSVALPVRGLAAGGHDAGETVRFYFHRLRRIEAGLPEGVDPLTLTLRTLGGGTGQVFSGAVAP
jgi:hypothetical protein